MSKLLTIFLGAIAGIVVLTFGIVLLPLLLPQKVDQWTIAGLAATFAGVMAALLAIIGAATVAFNWLYLEQRVEKVLKAKADDIKRALFSDLHEQIRAMGEFAIIWSAPGNIEKKDNLIRGLLIRAPGLFNVAALMAGSYIASVLNPYNPIGSLGESHPSKDELLNLAYYWGKAALDALDSHDPGLPQYTMAQVRSLQKEPESAIDFLKQALQKDPSIKEITITDDRKWQIFTGMTRGESQLKKLDALFKILEFERPALAEVKYHCTSRNQHHMAKFTAIKKSNGDYLEVVVEGFQERQDDPTITWRIRNDMELQRPVANLDEVMKVIEEVVIPTKLIPNEV